MTVKTKSYLKAVACFLLYVFMQVIGGVIALFLSNYQYIASGRGLSTDSLADNPQWLGIGILVASFLILILLWASMLVRRRPLPRMHPAMPWHWAVPLFAFLLLSLGLNIFITPMHLDDGGVAKLFEGMAGNPLCIILLTIVGPVTEELVFREGIQRHLKTAGLQPVWAIVATALLFALAHGNMAQGLAAFLLGVVLGLLYERTGDIRLSAPAHILNNTMAVVLFFMPAVDDSIEKMNPVPVFCGGILLALSALWLLMGWWKKSLTKIPPVACE